MINAECDEQLLALLRGCAKEERASQKMLYKRFYGYAMSVCLRYAKSREEALEVLNDGFLKVFTKIDKYNPELSFKGWVRRIMINTALDQYRKEYKHYGNSDLQEHYEGASTEANVLSRLGYQDMLALVQQLSPAYRTVFNLYAIDGYTHDEIAEMLNISVGTSKSNLSKARANLQEMIKKNYRDEYARAGK